MCMLHLGDGFEMSFSSSFFGTLSLISLIFFLVFNLRLRAKGIFNLVFFLF